MRYILSICSILLLVQDLDIIQGKVTLIPRNSHGSMEVPVPKRQNKVSEIILKSKGRCERKIEFISSL